ncbi:MAG: RNA polymerase factor sigma-32 [Sorangiineae bacterium]|nr:RNA polymerase factor sigma-32 [Sorangiineae bacterium]MEB2343303.1 RNA polymerase factor sigma-32 [Deltaproteobacteria bacterium]
MTNSPNPDVSRYISTVHGYPKLEREEEADLARRWRATQDRRAADRLVRSHLRYVVAIALKYRRYGLPLQELIAEGNFGLVHALAKFEPERGNRFVTYAAYWIRAYVLNYIIRSWSLVGVGSGALRSKMFFKLRRERVRVTNLVGEGELADQMLAERFKLPAEQVRGMLRRLETRDLSLDATVFDDSATRLVDTLASPELSSEEASSASQLRDRVRDTVRSAVTGLDERERFIVEHRLMADREDELSLAEIGRRLGVSRERARQLEARAKRKLKTRIEELSAASGDDWLHAA